jgi:hypothetical protein
MCLIITVAAAVIATLLYLFKSSLKNSTFAALPLFYWGASLMWTVDGIFNLKNGEAFCEISLNDTMLGLLIAVCGIAAFGIYVFFKKHVSSAK